MESPGEYLKREREHRGIQLSAIHESTRIPMKCLAALEADDFDSLPHSAFTRGFIKSYCKRLGLDETDAVLRYEMFMRERAERADNFSASDAPGNKRRVFPFDKRYMLAAAAVIIAVIYFALAGKGNRAAQTENTAAAPQTKEADARKAAPSNSENPPAKDTQRSAAVKESPALSGNTEEKHTLSISAAEPAWVRMGIDGKPAFNVILKQGESASWRAAKGFQIVVGNAGGVSIIFDGKKLEPLGPSGKVVYVKLPDGSGSQKSAEQPWQ